MRDGRPEPAYPPRGLRRDAAARYVGVGTTKFDEWVERNLMPKGKLVDGVRVWDRFQLDMAFEDLPDDDSAPGLVPADQGWGAVR